MKNHIKIWFVAVGAILMVLFAMIPASTTLSLFTLPLVEEFGVSRTEVSLMFSISSFTGIFAALAIGPVLKKVSPKIVVVVAGCSFIIYFLTLGLANSMMPIYIAVVFKGICGIFAGMSMGQIVMAQWFKKGRGTLMSVISIAIAAAGAAAMGSFAFAIQSLGYRTVAIGEALIFGALIILIGIFCIDDAPEKIGYKPYGYEEAPAAPAVTEEKAVKPADEKPSLGLKRILGFPSFWLLAVVTLLGSLSTTVFTTHGSPFFQSLGLDPVGAGLAMSVWQFAGMGWSLLFGLLSDKKGVGVATIVCGGGFAVAMFGAVIWTGWIGAIIAAILIAAGGTLSTLIGPLLTTNLFGTKEAGSLIGFTRSASSVGAVIGPLFAGAIFDFTQSYTLCLEIVGVFAVIIIIFTLWAGGKKARENIQRKIDELAAQEEAAI